MLQEEFVSASKKYITPSNSRNNISRIQKTSKNIGTEQVKKTRKYKYQYSNVHKANHKDNIKNNINNKSNIIKLYEIENSNINYKQNIIPIKQNLNINSTNNDYINNSKYMLEILEKSDNDINKGSKFDNDPRYIKNNKLRYINKKNLLSTEDLSDEYPLKLKSELETKYSINNLVFVKYVNGTNKKIYQKSYIRVADKKFKLYKNKEKISEADNSNIILEKNDNNIDKYIDDASSEYTFGIRKYNNTCLYEESKIEASEEKDNNRNEKNADNSKDKNLNNKRKVINKKYYVFEHKNNNMRNIKKVRYNDRIFHVETIPIIFSDDEVNIKNSKIFNKNIVRYNSSDNINNRSIRISKYSKINTKYDKLKNLRNINKVKNIRMNHKNNFNNMDNLYLCHCKKNYNIKRNNRSLGKKDLTIQNAQNMQVIQDEKLQIMIPIPPHKIDYACNLEIYGKAKKEYNKIKIKKNLMEENELIKRREEENNNIKYIRAKKQSWNLTNEEIKATKFSYQNINRNKIVNKNQKLDINNNEFHEKKIIKEKKGKKQKMKKKHNNKEYNIENFNINISDDGRKFRGQMFIEKNNLELEKQAKSPNSNFLLSSNEEILYNADYPEKDWNSIIRPINGRPLSIESKNKKVLLERSVEKLCFKGNNKPSNDWNINNNSKKEVDINIYQKKKKQKLSKQRIQPIAISGKKKNWNKITKKENETKLIIRGTKKKKEKDELIFNNNYNKIKENQKRSILLNIKKEKEEDEESMSSENDILKNIKLHNRQFDQYKNIIVNSFKSSEQPRQKIIINNISKNYPKRLEAYQENGENENNEYEIDQVIKGKKNNEVNILQSQPNEKNPYSPKIIITYQNNEINKKNISYSQMDQQPLHKKYYYREIITNNNSQLSNQNYPMKNNIKIEEQNDNYSSQQSEVKTSNSDFKRSYRENIIINKFIE